MNTSAIVTLPSKTKLPDWNVPGKMSAAVIARASQEPLFATSRVPSGPVSDRPVPPRRMARMPDVMSAALCVCEPIAANVGVPVTHERTWPFDPVRDWKLDPSTV